MNDIKHIYLWCLEDEHDSFGNFADISSRTISMYVFCLWQKTRTKDIPILI